MPRISAIEMLKKREQPTLVLHLTTALKDLPAVIGSSFAKLGAYLGTIGETLSEIPYVAFQNFNKSEVDVEIGFPVATPLPGHGDIEASAIPAGLYIFCMYRGAYNLMEPVYAEMDAYLHEHGFRSSAISYEYYYNGPGFPEEEMLTMVVMPAIK